MPLPLPPLTPRLHHRAEDGGRWPFHVWSFDGTRRVISSAPVGGGIGERGWIINAQVRPGYDRFDLAEHVAELAAAVELPNGPGVGMLTAANITGAVPAHDSGVDVLATVGIRVPTWAAAPPDRPDPDIGANGLRIPLPPGTINIVVVVPAPLSDAALVNLVATTTEAKAQALVEAGVPGTGTATDAVCIVSAVPRPGGPVEPFGGPRSTWGARAARATHESVRAGIGVSLRIIDGGDALAAEGNRAAIGEAAP